MTKATTKVPEPFLGPIFEQDIEPVIATGFDYHPEEIALHGVEKHQAIDFDVPRGTPILAPADGYYIATYGEALTRLEDGSPRKLSADKVRKANPDNCDLKPPSESGEWEVFYGSFVVQGWHGRGRYTQYAHVDWVVPKIPYYLPEEAIDEDGNKTGDLKHSKMLRATVDQYRKPGVAARLKAGEVIGLAGMTGCGWGRRCYDSAKFDSDGRPDFRNADYSYYVEPHLHFVTIGRRAPYTRDATAFDPFGIYGQVNDGYPRKRTDWPKRQPQAKHHPLWLPKD